MTKKPITEIDHLMTYVHDLDAASSLFRRMGFTLSPISRIEPMGISNHLVLMNPLTPGTANYIELMSSHDRSRLPAAMAHTLSGREGSKSIVLCSEDATVAYGALRNAGFDVKPHIHVKREWVIGPGESVFPEFDVILPAESPLQFNCCKYFNLPLYLRPEWLDHPNGAQSLTSVFGVTSSPSEFAAPFEQLFGNKVSAKKEIAQVTPGNVLLDLMTPSGARDRFGLTTLPGDDATYYLGYNVLVESVERLVECLDQGKVPYRRHGESICIDPSVGLGNLIVFTEGTKA